MNLNNKIINNFFTEKEFDIIKNWPKEKINTKVDRPGKEKKFTAYYRFFDIHDSWIRNMLIPKLEKHFFKGLDFMDFHILESFYPYTLHHDFAQNYPEDKPNPALTLIIPLEDYNSNTLVFKQQPKMVESKTALEWVENENPPKVKNPISDEFYQKYLTHENPYLNDFLELEEIYSWKENVCFAASQYKFHTSDNFLANGIKKKMAVVIWTCY
jgi:hypothetical protein